MAEKSQKGPRFQQDPRPTIRAVEQIWPHFRAKTSFGRLISINIRIFHALTIGLIVEWNFHFIPLNNDWEHQVEIWSAKIIFRPGRHKIVDCGACKCGGPQLSSLQKWRPCYRTFYSWIGKDFSIRLYVSSFHYPIIVHALFYSYSHFWNVLYFEFTLKIKANPGTLTLE